MKLMYLCMYLLGCACFDLQDGGIEQCVARGVAFGDGEGVRGRNAECRASSPELS